MSTLEVAHHIARLRRSVCLSGSVSAIFHCEAAIVAPALSGKKTSWVGSSILECRGSNYKIFVAKTLLYHLQQNIPVDGYKSS